ncbi:MAG: hypothetical protein WBD20_07585 [Pirellulaceae bacterium]
MPTRFAYSFLVIAVFVGMTSVAEPLLAHQWQWKLKAGDKFDVTLDHSTVSDTEVGDFKAKQTNRYKLATTWVVKSVDDQQVATIEKTIESIQFSVDSKSPLPMSINVDTATGAASGKTMSGVEATTFLKHMQSLIGKTLRIEMKPNGETKTLPIPEETQAAIDAFPPTAYVLQTFPVNTAFDGETTYFVTLPAKMLEPSETWQQESGKAVHENEAFVTTQKYVGHSKSDGTVLDEFTTTSLPKKAGDRELLPGKPDPMTVRKQKGTGQCFFDRTNGHFTKSSYRNAIVMKSEAQNSTITSEFATTVKRK